ncbi:sugar-binding domain-containing protein [Sporosarcina thermotolerans]|nr:sugar-binding domain-containing protein [Sporosarcina thermotolerans]WHT48111.1 sugar-binding domain-containing protein [Sporosarcina thermotolerans]
MAFCLEDKRELIKIAHYYYKDGLTQQEIAQKLSISRQKVNRSIKRLHEEGIVKIEIMKLEDSFEELESALEKKFNLRRVIVAHADSKEDITRQLGVAGAEFLMSQLNDDVKIGVSWGRRCMKWGLIYAMAKKEMLKSFNLLVG